MRSGQAIDKERDDRQLPFEVWYPAAPRDGGPDLNTPTQDTFTVLPHTPALHQDAVRDAAVHAGRYPLIAYSHTSGGDRRQSSLLCTHLASHGYVAAAADHVGNTAVDREKRLAAGVVRTQEEQDAYVRQIIADRVPDLRCLLDEMLGGAAGEISDQIDGERLGLIGYSFGGWAVLATPEVDDRVGAVVAMAPAGTSKPLPGILPLTLTFAWRREVPTLFLVAEHDTATPLPGQYELFERTPSSKRMLILRNAGHGHFGDDIEPGQCPPEHAHVFTRGLALAHMDAALKDGEAAWRFLAGDVAAVLRERGVDAIAHVG